jgi:LacI family transcriptional regulator
MDDTPDLAPGDPQPARARLARITDVARRAGVSTATVDRVLNRRPGVRPMTVERVMKAAAELGYVSEAEAHPALEQKPMRLLFLLPAGTNRFLAGLGRLIETSQAQLASFNVKARVDFIKSFNPELLAQHLMREARTADGIGFMALEHPAVREAVHRLADKGVPTVTLISDISAPRAAYVGLDNRSAGRTAGYLIARFIGPRPAKVAMIAGSLSYRAHEEREMGFLHLFQEMFPEVEVVGLREGHDDEAKNYRQTKVLLSQHPDLAGIYNIGGGSEGIVKALKEARREREVVLVGHGLTPETRALLIDGSMDAVITQNPQGTMMSCVAIFANLRAGRPPLTGVEPPRSEVIFRENLP